MATITIDTDKLAQALAAQLASLGAQPAQTVGGKYDGAEKYEQRASSLAEIQADFQSEVLPLIRDFVADLKAGGHIPAGKQLADAVIVIA